MMLLSLALVFVSGACAATTAFLWLQRRGSQGSAGEVDWTVLDWHRFVLAGGVLTVDAWERATPGSRAALILYRAGGAEASAEPQAAPPEPERVEPARSLTDELRAMGAAMGRPVASPGGAP